MKLLSLLLLSAPIWAQNITICLPYNAALQQRLNGEDKQIVVDGKNVTQWVMNHLPQTDLVMGEPAVERTGVTGRRMCYSHAFTEQDEATGLKRDSDLTALAKRLQVVAVVRGICTAQDTTAACLVKCRSFITIRRNGTLPADWRPTTTQ